MEQEKKEEQIKVELQDALGSDRCVALAAWTSSTTLEGKAKRTDEDVARIIKFLVEHRHTSPLESVVFRFWIKLPIYADRQHMCTRWASHSGLSGRFRTLPSEFLHVPPDVREIFNKMDDAKSHEVEDKYERLCQTTNQFYNDVLKIAKTNEITLKTITNAEYKRIREFIRGVLPQANFTERVTTINLLSFANYQKLRNSADAQPEIRRVAELMLAEVKKANVCPIAIEELEKINWKL